MKIILLGMDKDSIRWSKLPQFRCSCGMDRVWRALRLLPKEEVSDLVAAGENVEVTINTIIYIV